ncbi:hypothetical protein BH23CHL8_BH23CHL8_14090 [soil metagenome]
MRPESSTRERPCHSRPTRVSWPLERATRRATSPALPISGHGGRGGPSASRSSEASPRSVGARGPGHPIWRLGSPTRPAPQRGRRSGRPGRSAGRSSPSGAGAAAAARRSGPAAAARRSGPSAAASRTRRPSLGWPAPVSVHATGTSPHAAWTAAPSRSVHAEATAWAGGSTGSARAAGRTVIPDGSAPRATPPPTSIAPRRPGRRDRIDAACNAGRSFRLPARIDVRR